MSQSNTGHPKGLYLLYFTEMWERFSYYGMRAIFTLYMANALLFDKAKTSAIYGSYTGLVYLTPLIGGYIADRYWGNRRSIIFGGALMAIGQLLMFLSGSFYQEVELSTSFMFTGLGFLIVGNGFFKPNISTMVGQLYSEGDSKVDSAFTIFYQGINMGALLGNFICSMVGERYETIGGNATIIQSSFKYGFLAACIGMIISLVAFVWLKNKYVIKPDGSPIGLPPSKTASTAVTETPAASSGFNAKKLGIGVLALLGLFYLFFFILKLDLIGALIFSSSIVLPALIISDASLTKIEKDRILVIYIIAFFVIFFWSAFEQAGASLTFFAQEQTDREIFGWSMPASLFQIFNALFIVVLAPVTVSIWSWLNARGKEPVSPVKQAMGLGFLALGYLYIAWGVKGVNPWDKVSMIWLVGLYFIHTVGELCLSPIGLSMVVRLSPVRLASLLMGVWFMSTAAANKFAGDLSGLYPEEVKIETTAKADENVLSVLRNSPIDTAYKNLTAKDNIQVFTADYQLSDKKDQITSFSADSSKRELSVYHLKLIRTVSAKFDNALLSRDGKFILGYKKENKKNIDGAEQVVEQVEIWNLQPEKPSFLGMKINTLYDFFMIFVYMSGAAALILFVIHKWLLGRMHGVR